MTTGGIATGKMGDVIPECAQSAVKNKTYGGFFLIYYYCFIAKIIRKSTFKRGAWIYITHSCYAANYFCLMRSREGREGRMRFLKESKSTFTLHR